MHMYDEMPQCSRVLQPQTIKSTWNRVHEHHVMKVKHTDGPPIKLGCVCAHLAGEILRHEQSDVRIFLVPLWHICDRTYM